MKTLTETFLEEIDWEITKTNTLRTIRPDEYNSSSLVNFKILFEIYFIHPDNLLDSLHIGFNPSKTYTNLLDNFRQKKYPFKPAITKWKIPAGYAVEPKIERIDISPKLNQLILNSIQSVQFNLIGILDRTFKKYQEQFA